MYAHCRHLGERLGTPLTPILTGRKSLQGLIREQRAIPNHRARWCTRMLKLEPYYKWLAEQTPCVSSVGLRADEQSRPGMIFPDADGIQMRFPMQEWSWTIDDVTEFLRFKNVNIPERTDCAWCFWQRIGEWYLLWLNDLDEYMAGEAMEEWVTAERGKPYTFRSPDRDTWPASLKELRL